MVYPDKSHLDGMKRVYRDASIIYVIKKKIVIIHCKV